MKKRISALRDVLLTAGILAAAFGASLLIQHFFREQKVVPALFALAVFLISLWTDGYAYGIAAALVSVLIVNNTFTFPFYEFNFSLPENLISAIILIVITLVTSTLTSRLKRAEKAKLDGEMEKLRANLLRSVSHDFRTPLTAIYSSVSALLDPQQHFPQETEREMLESVRDSAQRLDRIVENLLSITRIDAGGVELVKTPTALDELIGSVLLVLHKQEPAQTVELSLPESIVIIPMDAMLIQQVLLNLLENAIQHAKGMTRLSLSVQCRDGKAEFRVMDDGCGIAPALLPKLFTGIRPAEDRSADSRSRNAGIGLAVCSSIIHAHGGEIFAENRPEGGACFRFLLDTEDISIE